MITLSDIQRIYFVGIGGIGMSALARYFHYRGAQVSGYDKTETKLTKTLVAEGIDIHYTDDPNRIPEGIDLVVYTPAIPKELQELRYLKAQALPIVKRAELLGMLSREKRTIAIAGTHGKTTTVAITAHLLRAGGIDATAFVGGLTRNLPHRNFAAGSSDWMVVEADEYDRSFLQLRPEVAVILSMDADHLDIYGDSQQMRESGFEAFAKCIQPGGVLFLRHGLSLSDVKQPRTFGVGEGACQAQQIQVRDGYFHFDYVDETGSISDIRWPMIGRHNIENAVAAIAIARKLGVEAEKIRTALSEFAGIERRADWIVRQSGLCYIDDYAHHPTELRAIIAAVKEVMPEKKLTGIFQPHLYTRTRDHAQGFAYALNELDTVLLMPIYPARELPIEGVTTHMIYERMDHKKSKVIEVNENEIIEYLNQHPPEVLLTLGAGDIDKLVAVLKKWIHENAR